MTTVAEKIVDIDMIAEPSRQRKRFYFSNTFPNMEPLYWPEIGVTIYALCNIYKTASFGRGVKVGFCTEIGNEVWIGDEVTIGAFCFIPEGVMIDDGAWIGPRVTFTNDKFPPSDKSKWQKTIIKKGARLGAGVTVLCGVTIGERALIGAGSVVTKDIPADAVYAGVPARPIIHTEDEDAHINTN